MMPGAIREPRSGTPAVTETYTSGWAQARRVQQRAPAAIRSLAARPLSSVAIGKTAERAKPLMSSTSSYSSAGAATPPNLMVAGSHRTSRRPLAARRWGSRRGHGPVSRAPRCGLRLPAARVHWAAHPQSHPPPLCRCPNQPLRSRGWLLQWSSQFQSSTLQISLLM